MLDIDSNSIFLFRDVVFHISPNLPTGSLFPAPPPLILDHVPPSITTNRSHPYKNLFLPLIYLLSHLIILKPYLLDILQDRIKLLPILEIFTTKWLQLLPYPVLNPPFPISLSSHTIISLLLIKLSLLPFPFPLNPLPMLRLPKILNGRLLWLLK